MRVIETYHKLKSEILIHQFEFGIITGLKAIVEKNHSSNPQLQPNQFNYCQMGLKQIYFLALLKLKWI